MGGMKKDKQKSKRVRKGIRLAITKAPKVEVPASVYTRKRKHKRPAPPDE